MYVHMYVYIEIFFSQNSICTVLTAIVYNWSLMNLLSIFKIPNRKEKQKRWNFTLKSNYFKHPLFCRVRQITFFLEICFKKNYWIFDQISFFYLKVQFFRLIMENNFIRMAASAGHADPIRSVQFLSTLSIVCSCISPMPARIYLTYLIGHCNLSIRIIDLVSHTTYVVCVNSINKSTPNDRFFEKLFIAILSFKTSIVSVLSA